MNNGTSKRNFIHDNIVVNPSSTKGALATIHSEGVDIVNYALEQNDLSIITDDWCYTYWQNTLKNYDAQPGYKAKVAELWPGLLDITCDLDRMFDADFCMNSSATIRNNAEINLTGAKVEYYEAALLYSDISGETAYTVDENPFFVNPSIGDYRMKADADFANIPFEKIGRY